LHRCGPRCSRGRRWTSAASAFCCWMTARCGSRLQHSSSCGRTCGCCCWSPFGWCAAAATAGPSPAARSPAGSWQSCSSSSSRTGPGPRGHPPQLWGAPVLAQGPQPGPVASQVHCQVAAQRGAVHAGGGRGAAPVHRRWLGMMDRGVQWGGGLGGCHVGTCSVSAGHDSYRVNNCPPAGEWQVVLRPPAVGGRWRYVPVAGCV
jgi:hypothetical protein